MERLEDKVKTKEELISELKDEVNKIIIVVNGHDTFKTRKQIQDWSDLSDWIDNFKILYKFCKQIVATVSLASDLVVDSVESDVKLEAAVQILDDAMRLPIYVELFDGPLIRIMIKFAVCSLNDKFGHGWKEKDLKELVKTGI